MVSLILLFPKYIRYRKRKVTNGRKYDAVLTMASLSNKIPRDFEGEYVSQEFDRGSLSDDDVKLFKSIVKRYPFSLVLKKGSLDIIFWFRERSNIPFRFFYSMSVSSSSSAL